MLPVTPPTAPLSLSAGITEEDGGSCWLRLCVSAQRKGQAPGLVGRRGGMKLEEQAAGANTCTSFTEILALC